MEKVKLFEKGCLGTCWCGKYHYFEPWVGCSNDCAYCYAKYRKSIKEKIESRKSVFPSPFLAAEKGIVLSEIKKQVLLENVMIAKLCRFTDIFSKPFSENGFSFEVLKELAESKIKRIIITTKGLPDKKSLALIESFKEKFSYNFALRPINDVIFENNIENYENRISAASQLAAAGVLVTAHLDPFVAGTDDGESLDILLAKLKNSGINRAMFSYLLLSRDMIENIKAQIGEKKALELFKKYDFSKEKEYLTGQEDTVYFSLLPSVKKESSLLTAKKLEDKNFEFVMCSLKSGCSAGADGLKRENICDGNFYA